MAGAEAPCYTIVFEDATESATTQELRSALEKGSDAVKLETLRKIIVSTINGNSMVSYLSANEHIPFSVSNRIFVPFLAPTSHADHPIRDAFTE